ncbi:MAG: hypothetical protein KGZ83_01985 [Sulfuricella sp.]|nr:hypothetical protein [Sulfuricella sp.]
MSRMKVFPRFFRNGAALFLGVAWLAASSFCAAQEPGSFAAIIQAATEDSKKKAKNSPPPKQAPAPEAAKPLTPPAAKPAESGAKAPGADAKPQETPLPPAEKSGYAEIYEKNVFDPKRQPWVEKIEVPPPPAVAPLTQGDAELLGVMGFGSFKKVILKLGPGFKFAPQPKNKAAPRPFVILAVGESLGPYTLAEIGEKKVIFDAGGTQYPLTFTPKKTDRPPPSAVTPMAQAPVILAAPTPTIVQGIEPLASATAPAAPAGAAPMDVAAQGQAPAAGTGMASATPAPAAAAPTAATDQNAAAAGQAPVIQGRTLLEAIQAARTAQAAGQITTPAANPFAK